MNYYLGIKVEQDTEGRKTKLSQTSYAERLLSIFDSQSSKVAATPMDKGVKLVKYEGTVDKNVLKEYQAVLGALMYLAF